MGGIFEVGGFFGEGAKGGVESKWSGKGSKFWGFLAPGMKSLKTQYLYM